MNRFLDTFNKFPTDKPQYADFYNRIFTGINPKIILEIGVLKGGSLAAWKELFPSTKVVGIDINQSQSLDAAEKYNLDVHIGSQIDPIFLNKVIAKIGLPDIIIDDGGHTRALQVGSFKILFPLIAPGAFYVIEDIETSFMHDYNDSPTSVFDMLGKEIFPIGWNGDTRNHKVGDTFNYSYSQLLLEQNIVMLRKR